MTILNLPDGINFAEFILTPHNATHSTQMEGRRNETLDAGEPFWSLKAQTVTLNDAQMGIIAAWLMQASKGGVRFKAHDVTRPRPFSSRLTPIVPVGGSLSAVNNSREVQITGAKANLALAVGDFIGFQTATDKHSLHTITEAVTLTGSGAGVIKFEFPLNQTEFPVGTPIVFEKPSALFKLSPNVEVPKAWGSRIVEFSASEAFTA